MKRELTLCLVCSKPCVDYLLVLDTPVCEWCFERVVVPKQLITTVVSHWEEMEVGEDDYVDIGPLQDAIERMAQYLKDPKAVARECSE